MNPIEKTLRDVAEAGRAVMMRHFRALESIETKELEFDLLTRADLECEAAVKGIIADRFPSHAILAEESADEFQRGGGADWIWIIDPIDGTTNYAHGLPLFSLSVGVWHAGRMEMGMVLNPALDDLYFAERGKGATRNGKAIHVSPENHLGAILAASGFAYDKRERVDLYLAQWRAILLHCRDIRRLGSAAMDLCLVASGEYGLYWESSLHPWDWAAGALIVQEAGGQVTDLAGRPFDLWQSECVATNGLVHDRALALLRGDE